MNISDLIMKLDTQVMIFQQARLRATGPLFPPEEVVQLPSIELLGLRWPKWLRIHLKKIMTNFVAVVSRISSDLLRSSGRQMYAHAGQVCAYVCVSLLNKGTTEDDVTV